MVGGLWQSFVRNRRARQRQRGVCGGRRQSLPGRRGSLCCARALCWWCGRRCVVTVDVLHRGCERLRVCVCGVLFRESRTSWAFAPGVSWSSTVVLCLLCGSSGGGGCSTGCHDAGRTGSGFTRAPETSGPPADPSSHPVTTRSVVPTGAYVTLVRNFRTPFHVPCHVWRSLNPRRENKQ